MASRRSDIEALLTRSERVLEQIEAEYQRSLDQNEISAELRIDIKNLCENLRSVLDYLAHDIRERFCPNAKGRFYFPILPDRKQFEKKVAAWFPDLDTKAPELWKYLESIQSYHSNRAWLGQFNSVNNDNKHDSLVEQTRYEIEQVRATGQSGGQVSWNPANVRFGRGVLINGVPVDPATQLPVPDPSQLIERILWVDFQFEGIGVSALQLLKRALSGTSEIFNEVFSKM